MQPVLSFVEGSREPPAAGRLVDDVVGHFVATVAGQAVQVDGVLVRRVHDLLVADPVLVLVKDLLCLFLI